VIEPFHITVADEVLEDLAARLERTRPPSPPVLDGGESPETVKRIEELIAYWRSGYDWRAREARLNAVPHFRAAVGDARVHFVHVQGSGPDPLPLLLANGWPSSFVEYLGVLDRLADPAAYGGDPADAFSVVVPALPGYGFSAPYPGRLDRATIAGLFDRLMVESLGYASYVAHGDDIGGGVVNRLGMYHAGPYGPSRPPTGSGRRTRPRARPRRRPTWRGRTAGSALAARTRTSRRPGRRSWRTG
jgi:hypothetical protein